MKGCDSCIVRAPMVPSLVWKTAIIIVSFFSGVGDTKNKNRINLTKP